MSHERHREAGYEPPVILSEGNVREVGDRADLTAYLSDLKKDKGYFHSSWSSPEKFARHISKMRPEEAQTDSGWSSRDEDFYGTKTMDDALDLAQEGWHEGAERVQKMIGAIHALIPTSNRLVKYGIAGSVPNVPRAVAGNIFNMKVPDPSKSRKKPVITLFSNMTASWSVDQEVISNRSAAVCALIDQIEAKGFSCEVISFAYAHGSRDFRSCTTVVVKESHQPVDIARMSYALGHVSFWRRLIFADWGFDKMCIDNIGRHLGLCYAPKKEGTNERGAYLIPSPQDNQKNFKDLKSTVDEGIPWLIEELRKQGCPAFPKLTPQELEDLEEEDSEGDYYDDDDDF